MNNQKAHMLRTNPNWFYFLKLNNATGIINFWRKDTKSITNIHTNDRIYFLRKKTKDYPKISIIGMAIFDRYEILTPEKAWISFQTNNGCRTLTELLSNFSSKTEKIGCLLLKDIVYFENEIYLSDANISFSPKIQSRKSLSYIEESNILDLINGIKPTLFKSSTDEIKIGKDIERVIKARVNQTYFRYSLINLYKKCVLCGLTNTTLLRASHSKPWSESNPSEKVDPMNGLLLCPNHDLLYDKHLITFDKNKKIMISPALTENDIKLLNISKDSYINLPDEAMKYIEYHRHKFKEQLNNKTDRIKV